MLYNKLKRVRTAILRRNIYVHAGHPTYKFSLSVSNSLASHTNYLECVNFMHEWLDLQFKVASEFFRSFSLTDIENTFSLFQQHIFSLSNILPP